jgi:hypothetical protein
VIFRGILNEIRHSVRDEASEWENEGEDEEEEMMTMKRPSRKDDEEEMKRFSEAISGSCGLQEWWGQAVRVMQRLLVVTLLFPIRAMQRCTVTWRLETQIPTTRD